MRTRQTRSWIPLAVLFVATLVAARTAEAGDKNRIKSVSFADQGQSTTVRVKGSATPTFTVYKLERPNRVVLDIAGAELGAAVEQAQENGQTLAVATWAVNQIAAYELDDGGALVRIVVTLARPGRYDVKTDGDDLVVTVVARDDAPAKADPEALAEAKDAEAKAKKDSETAKAARGKAEDDAAKARAQAETSKQEADKAKKALAEAKDAAARAEKAGKADRERADRALADARAEAERTRKAAEQAKLEADRTRKSVEAAQAEAERTKKAAAQARADVERLQAEVIAAKAEAKAKGQEAADAKADAKARGQEAADAKADARARGQEAADAKADAADAKADAAARKKEAAAAKADAAARKQEAAEARAEAERNKKEAAAAKAEADRRTKEAETARAEARQARADADAAQQQAADKQRAAEAAQQDAADQKRAAAAARKEAAADKRDAAAMRAEAEEMLGEAKQRASEAAAEAKAAKKIHEAALAAQQLADKSEESARQAEATAAAERKSAQAALDKAEKARAAGDRDADGRVAAAEARLRKAEQARTAAEDQRKQAETAAATARDEAARRKAETADAVAAKGAAEKERKAAQQAADEAEQRAERAEQLRKDEDQATRRAAEARVAVEDAERAKAGKKELAAKRAEAKRLEKEAAVARGAREREESQLAGVIAERRQAEKDLARARTARTEAEAATAAAQREAVLARQQAEDARREAEDANRQAQVARDDAEQARIAAEQARDAERVAKKAATAEQAAARKAAAAEQAAVAEEAAIARKEAAAAKKSAARGARAPSKRPAPLAQPPEAEPAAKAIAIRDVAFQQDGADSRIIVELSGEVDAEVVRSDRKSAELVLSGVSLPDKLQRKLDVSKFDGAVRAISTFTDPKDATRVRVVVELSGDATPRLEKVGNTVRWHFAAAAPAVAKRKPKAKAKGKTRDLPAPVVGGYGASSAPVTSKSVAQAGGSRKKVYRGPTIDLDFKDADIHNLLRFLANIGRVSIVVPDDIKATVTVRLKRVPWDQALEVILASKGLWYRKEGSLYRIAPRKQLDAEDQAEAERIRAAVQSEAPEAEVFTLNYASAAETQDKLVPLLSPKGKIEVDSRTNSLIINDIRAHRRRIIDLASRLDTQTPQIMIEARIVEARSTYAREFGIQWGGRANASQAGGNATGLIFPNSIGVGGGADDRTTPTAGVATPSDFAVNLPATVGTGAGGAIGLSLGSVGGNFNLNLRLSAAEDTGTVRIISSPKITVLNNTEASISQGVSIPISVVSASGTQTQFVPADLSLTVTPYVSQRDCSIAMTINVTKNEPDFVNTGARGDPTILRKEANTRILVADGETTVMGGITTRNVGLAYNKVPFLGDLPVIGWFFKSRRENDDRTELLIFITPTITNKAFLRCE